MTTVADVVKRRMKGENFKAGSSEEDFLFASHCVQNRHMSYSQSLQDLWVLYELGTQPGYFIDFGAGNGRDSSNSYILHRAYGWKGLLIEPNTDYADNLAHHVSDGVKWYCGVAVSNENKPEVDFLVSSDPSISTLHYSVDADSHGSLRRRLPSELRKIETVTLLTLCNAFMPPEPEKIDYLSIDTEGSEFDILSEYFAAPAHDIRRHLIMLPSLITVEHNYNQTNRDKIYNLLSNNGYVRRFEDYSAHDDFYILKSQLRNER